MDPFVDRGRKTTLLDENEVALALAQSQQGKKKPGRKPKQPPKQQNHKPSGPAKQQSINSSGAQDASISKPKPPPKSKQSATGGKKMKHARLAKTLTGRYNFEQLEDIVREMASEAKVQEFKNRNFGKRDIADWIEEQETALYGPNPRSELQNKRQLQKAWDELQAGSSASSAECKESTSLPSGAGVGATSITSTQKKVTPQPVQPKTTHQTTPIPQKNTNPKQLLPAKVFSQSQAHKRKHDESQRSIDMEPLPSKKFKAQHQAKSPELQELSPMVPHSRPMKTAKSQHSTKAHNDSALMPPPPRPKKATAKFAPNDSSFEFEMMKAFSMDDDDEEKVPEKNERKIIVPKSPLPPPWKRSSKAPNPPKTSIAQISSSASGASTASSPSKVSTASNSHQEKAPENNERKIIVPKAPLPPPWKRATKATSASNNQATSHRPSAPQPCDAEPYLKPGKHGWDYSLSKWAFEGDPDLYTGEGHQVEPADQKRLDEDPGFYTAFREKYPGTLCNQWPCGCVMPEDGDESEEE